MDGFQKELLNRLPLAQASMRVAGYALDPAGLADVYKAHRGSCYESILTFEGLVRLVLDALAVYGGSGNQAFNAASARGDLPVAKANVYGKLGRISEGLSMALLEHGSARLSELFPVDRPAMQCPTSLRDWKIVAFDGKKIKNATKRLKPLRKVPGKLLGGKLLVLMDVETGLVLCMNADPDGERNDVPLVPAAVEQLRRRVSEPVFWMGDRQFGNLEIPQLLSAKEGDSFLLRCPKTLKLQPDPKRKQNEFQDDDHRTVVQEWGWIGAPHDPRRRYVRRITLERAKDPVILITDLLDDDKVPGQHLLDIYRQRWGIERVFQQVTEVFNLQTLIGSSPQAMIFQASLCFMLYNIVQVVRAYLAEDGEQPIERVSSEKLFWAVRDELAAWSRLGDARTMADALGLEPALSAVPANMIRWLRSTVHQRWTEQYLKAPPKRKKSPPEPAPKVPKGHGGHTSTYRVLQADRDARRKTKRS